MIPLFHLKKWISSVVFEDDDILVVDKPAGIVVHPTMGYKDGTLANGIAYHAKKRGESYPFRPVTRLDKDTSGSYGSCQTCPCTCYVVETDEAKAISTKVYRYLSWTCYTRKGTIDLPIGTSPTSIIERVIDPQNGKEAITHYESIAKLKEATMVALSLETGRTHQIRLHLAAIGHPIIGDTLYGSEREA